VEIMPSMLEMTKEKFEEYTERFEKIYSILRGRVDVKSRLMLLLNPDKIQTSTRLTRAQVQFVALSFSAAEQWEFMEPIKQYAEHFCLTNISLEGKGIESAIRFTGALAESKLLQKIGILQKEAKADE